MHVLLPFPHLKAFNQRWKAYCSLTDWWTIAKKYAWKFEVQQEISLAARQLTSNNAFLILKCYEITVYCISTYIKKRLNILMALFCLLKTHFDFLLIKPIWFLKQHVGTESTDGFFSQPSYQAPGPSLKLLHVDCGVPKRWKAKKLYFIHVHNIYFSRQLYYYYIYIIVLNGRSNLDHRDPLC